MIRQWFDPGKNAKAGEIFGVEMIGIFGAFDGPTRLPGAGRLARSLETISIHPELPVQDFAGMVKLPLYVEPATRTIVSPQLDALMAF